MLNQVNILDRDCRRSKEHESEKKGNKKIKFTEKSNSNVKSSSDFLFASSRAYMQTSLDYEEKADKIERKLSNKDKLSLEELAILNSQMVTLRSLQYYYNKKAVKSYNRAISLKDFMQKNIFNHFRNFCLKVSEKLVSFAEKLNVTEVNVPNVNKIFEQGDENEIGLDINALDEEIRKAEQEQTKEEVVNKKVVNNDDSIYSYKKSDVVQDNIYSGKTTSMETPADILERNNATDNDIAQNNINSESSVPFSKFEGDSISDEIPVNTSFTDFNKNLSSISESIDGENYTIKDLEALRSAIEQERKTQEELKNRLENQRIEKENAEKEAKEAEREKEAKIKFANEQLAAYRAENQKLKNQQIEVEQETQRKLSARQAAMNQIAEINQMLAGGNLNNSIVNSNRRGK